MRGVCCGFKGQGAVGARTNGQRNATRRCNSTLSSTTNSSTSAGGVGLRAEGRDGGGASAENLVQDILGNFQCELSKPYLFYRNKGVVNGIWFYDPQECEAIVQLVQKIQSMFNTGELAG